MAKNKIDIANTSLLYLATLACEELESILADDIYQMDEKMKFKVLQLRVAINETQDIGGLQPVREVDKP